ncbi:MAG TPA: PIN domain-containing protein [Lacibacter sp.]|nr:PIN domain-containing protein [Lacibacter sp.]HMO90014.1 PIN domain-containing protein [Lacibacter sp.]HMP86960.1 PIN domain-containing protein [Lacibacter sp.]
MKHLFLDTNILLDVLADRQPFSEPAALLLELAEKKRVRLYVSALSYAVLAYLLKKQLSHRELVKTLRDLEALTVTLDVSGEVISGALSSGFTDLEDAIQYHTALSQKRITAIITRNGGDFRKSELAVLTAAEALSLLAKEK